MWIFSIRPTAAPSLLTFFNSSQSRDLCILNHGAMQCFAWRSPRTNAQGWCFAMLVSDMPEHKHRHTPSLLLFSLNCRRGGKDTEFIPMETESLHVRDERCPLCWLKKKPCRPCLTEACSMPRCGRQSPPEFEGFIPTISSYWSEFGTLRESRKKGPEISHSIFSWGEPSLMTQR